MIDLHNHLIPGVDDGAADLEQAITALTQMAEQGFRTVIATPHLRASQLAMPEELAAYLAAVDAAWEALRARAGAELPGVRLERGFEIMMDTMSLPLDDPRLRLAGTRFVLLEFPFMAVPPNASQVFFDLRMAGHTPVLAHPERYPNLAADGSDVAEWRRVGAVLQVNAGSLLGKYGPEARRAAWKLVEQGSADLLGSDYHARGSCHTAAAREALEKAGGSEQALLLTETNPGRLLANQPLHAVPPLGSRPSLLQRLFGRR